MNSGSPVYRSTGQSHGWRWKILMWAALLVVGMAVAAAIDAASSPWAYSFFGTRPTLVGEWVASFTIPTGQRGAAYLRLTHPYVQPRGNGDSTRWVEGTAQSCFDTDHFQTYEVYGRPNTSGSDVPLEFKPHAPFSIGYSLQSLRGAWNGDTLRLEGTLNHITDSTGATVYAGGDVNQNQPTTLTFRKGSLQDFADACWQLAP
jgi:opacity protein-like surface antigen